MGVFLTRVTGPLLGLALALFSFVLQAVARRRKRAGKKVCGVWTYIAARLGGAGAVYLIVLSALNLARYPPGLASILLVSAPLLLFAAALLAHFELLAFDAPAFSTRKARAGNYAAAAASALQAALLVFSLVSRWRNFTTGTAAYLYLLLVTIVIAGADGALFFVSARRGREAA
ncbi:MAG: hypothetical protein LBR16_03790 [Treponema sp.]|jgi:hypothetical protein|nr:hypothetical protein [Treponema sp.]